MLLLYTVVEDSNYHQDSIWELAPSRTESLSVFMIKPFYEVHFSFLATSGKMLEGRYCSAGTVRGYAVSLTVVSGSAILWE